MDFTKVCEEEMDGNIHGYNYSKFVEDKIINLEKKNSISRSNNSDRFIVNHYFVDFQYLILGQKIKKKIASSHVHSNFRNFDDEYFANMMVTNDENLEFYEQ